MGKIAKLFVILDIVLILFYILARDKLNLSFEIISLLLSLTIGINFFMLFVLVVSYIKKIFLRKKAKTQEVNYKLSIFTYLLGIILSIVVIILSFNSSLYLQALLGNDLFLSLTLDKENFILENGNNLFITADFAIAISPFCSASCSLSLKDLSSGKVLFFEEAPISVSTPVSKRYEIFVNESYSGQKLYRIDFECASEKKLFCYTATNKTKHTSKVLSVEHSFNEEQKQSLEDLKDKITSLNSNYSQLILNLNEINSTISNSSSLNLSEWIIKISSLNSKIEEDNLAPLIELYSEQKFTSLKDTLQEKYLHLTEFNNDFFDIYKSINLEVNSYNGLIDRLYFLKANVSLLYSLDMDSHSLTQLNDLIDSFNLALTSFKKYSDLSKKKSILNELILLRANLNLSGSSNESSRLEKKLNEIDVAYLILNLTILNFSLNLNNPSPICCLSNNCEICLNENYPSTNYPIILLHGHGFNEKISALSSLETFNSFQDNLEDDGYVNAGSLLYLDYSPASKRVLGKINRSVTFKVSYYFDILSTEQGYSLLETKTDNLDTYSIRLKDIIDNIKYITGKDKVILVAHSMGGLVARRYIQVFGEDSIDKLILITVPNHGVEGFVVDYCSFLGTKDECEDMKSGSLFLNKLNRVNPNIPTYNIIGEGCEWENSIGDGIVKNNSSYLSYAKNYYVNGTCNGFTYFHNTILDAKLYTEGYNIVKEILKI